MGFAALNFDGTCYRNLTSELFFIWACLKVYIKGYAKVNLAANGGY